MLSKWSMWYPIQTVANQTETDPSSIAGSGGDYTQDQLIKSVRAFREPGTFRFPWQR